MLGLTNRLVLPEASDADSTKVSSSSSILWIGVAGHGLFNLKDFLILFASGLLVGSSDTNGGIGSCGGRHPSGFSPYGGHGTPIVCPRLPDQMDDQGSNRSCLKEQNLS